VFRRVCSRFLYSKDLRTVGLVKDVNNKVTFLEVLQCLKVEIGNRASKTMLLGQNNDTHGRKQSGQGQCNSPVTGTDIGCIRYYETPYDNYLNLTWPIWHHKRTHAGHGHPSF